MRTGVGTIMQQKRNDLHHVEALGGLDSDYPPEDRAPRSSGLRPAPHSRPDDGPVRAGDEPDDGALAEDVTIPRAPLASLMTWSEEDRTLGMSVELQERLQTLAAEGRSLLTEDKGQPAPFPPARFDRTAPMPEPPPRSADIEASSAAPSRESQERVFAERRSWQWLEPPPPVSTSRAAVPPTGLRPTAMKTGRVWLWRGGVLFALAALAALAALTAFAALALLGLVGLRWFPR